jgi:hypothetical protein
MEEQYTNNETTVPVHNIGRKHKQFGGKKRLIMVGGGVVALGAILAAGWCFVLPLLNSNSPTALMEKYGKKYYSEFFYTQMEGSMDSAKKDEFLKKSAGTGLSVSLENLLRYLEYNVPDELARLKDGTTACDAAKSKIVITPTEPYGASNFNIKTELSGC